MINVKTAFKSIYKNRLVVSLVFSILFSLFILPVTEAIYFDVSNIGQSGAILAAGSKLLFALLLFFLTLFSINFTNKIINKDAFYLSWLRLTLIYLGILLIVLLFIFPGYWVWDEFYVLNKSQIYEVYSWQHIFTQLHYIMSLYLIPSSTGITVLQILFIAFIVGYITAKLREYIGNKTAYLIGIIFLLPPVLLYNFYTLRLTLYTYLLLLLLFKVILVFTSKNKITRKESIATFLGLSVLVAIVAFWRSEGIIYVLLLPFLAYKLQLIPFRRSKVSVATIIISVIILLTSFVLTRMTTAPNYQITAAVNPLSLMVQEDLAGKYIDEAWADIDKVLDVNLLRAYPSYTEVPAFHLNADFLRKDYENHLNDFYKAYAYIIINNPSTFIKYRIATYLATNNIGSLGLYNNSSQSYGQSVWSGLFTEYSLVGCQNMYKDHCKLISGFDTKSKLNNAINPELRSWTIDQMIRPTGSVSRAILWNVTLSLILCVFVLIHAAIRRKWLWAGITLLIIGHAGIVFLTAPAISFMYYFPVYLLGLVIPLIYILISYADRTLKDKR